MKPTFKMYPAFNHRIFRAAQMHIILIDKRLRNFNQRDRARQPAIIPPIGFERGNIVFVARVIDGGHDEVIARMNRRGHLAVEAGVTALVLADLLRR